MAAKTVLPDKGKRGIPFTASLNSIEKWAPPVILAWLFPGIGHFYLNRRKHAALLLFAITGMFILGLMMRGRMFEPESADLFNTVVNYGGYFGDLCNGALYFLAGWLGYSQEVLPGAAPDYGTKFLVCAGLLNLLAVVDVYEIATGAKK